MAKSKKTPGNDAKRRNDTIGLWTALGAGFGLALGVIFGQLGLGSRSAPASASSSARS